MAKLCLSGSSPMVIPSPSTFHSRSYPSCKFPIIPAPVKTVVFASKPGGLSSSLNPFAKSCETCRGQGALECPGCKGTGRNKKNGNIFERWKCFECQGFGMKSCPECGKGGLTPEQRGER